MGAEISFVCVFRAPSCRLLICWEPAAERNDEGRKRNHRFCLLRSHELQNLMDSLVPDLVFTCLGSFPEFAQELKYILTSLARWLFSETLQGFFWQVRDEMSSPPEPEELQSQQKRKQFSSQILTQEASSSCQWDTNTGFDQGCFRAMSRLRFMK